MSHSKAVFMHRCVKCVVTQKGRDGLLIGIYAAQEEEKKTVVSNLS